MLSNLIFISFLVKKQVATKCRIVAHTEAEKNAMDEIIPCEEKENLATSTEKFYQIHLEEGM